MPMYVKSVSFYNLATLLGKFDSARDDAKLNKVLDGLRDAGAEIVDITPAASGGLLKYILTYVVSYEAPAPIR